MSDRPKPKARQTLLLLMALMAVAHLDRQILGITLDQIGSEFDLSDTQLGMLSGLIFALAFCLFGFPAAVLAARFSRRVVISGSAMIWSGMTILTAGAHSFSALVLARIGVGAGEAGSVAPAHSLISDLYPPERRASAMSIFATGTNIGVLLAFLIGGVVGQLYGWRAAFLAAGVPGLVLAALLAWKLHEPRKSASVPERIFGESLALMRADKGLHDITIAMALTGIVTFGTLSWGPTFVIRGYELSQAQTGLILALAVGIGGAIGTILSGLVADRLGARDRRWRLRFVSLAVLAGKPFTLYFLLWGEGSLGLAAMSVGALVGNVFWGPTFAYAHDRVPVHCRPMITAFLLFMFNLVGVGIGPTAIGALSDLFTSGPQGLGTALACSHVLGVMGAWLYWRAANAAHV